MKKLAFLLTLLMFIAPISGFQNFLDRHGIWLEDNEFSWIGLQKLYGAYTSGYDKEASDSSYLNIEFDPDRDSYKLYDNRYLPVEFTFRDDYGVKFTQLWISWSAVDGRRPLLAFMGENLDSFSNPDAKPTDAYIKRGLGYGDVSYRWECFSVPSNLRYAQPTTYKLIVLIEALKPFKMRLDAIYLGDGTYEPQNRNRPLRPGLPVDNPEKVLPWIVPVTEKFDRTMVPPLDKLVKNVDLVCTKGMRMPFVLAITGGLDLGKVTLNIDNPLKNGSNVLKTNVSTVSFMKKRWFRDASVDLKTEVPECLKPGNTTVITMGKTEFFWIDTIVPDDAKPGKYTTTLRIRTDNSSDYEIKLSIDVKDVSLPKPENLMIFHSRNHFLEAKSGKKDMEQAWGRYEKDFADIVDHGIKSICLPLFCIDRPNYVVDAPNFTKLVGIAANAGIKEIYVDISKAWGYCMLDAKKGDAEFLKSINDTSGILEENGFPPVYFIGKDIAEFDVLQLNLLDLLNKAVGKPDTAATFKEIRDHSPVTRQIFDFGDFDWKYVATDAPMLSWEPRPHWGGHGFAKTIAGIFNQQRKPAILAISDYQSVYGNSYDDFDQRLGDGSYTPGDLTMVYPDESYTLTPSIRWECLRLGLYDWGLLELLSRDTAKTGSFLSHIPTRTNSRNTLMYCTPKWQDEFWNRGMQYLDWVLGGEKVEPVQNTHTTVFTLGSKKFTFDGKEQLMTVEPTVISGRTFIPAKYLIEPLLGTVSWEQTTKTVTCEVINHSVKLVVGSSKAKVDGKDIDMSSSPVIVSGRTLIPLRDASTLLGASVNWDATTKQAKITFVTGTRY